MEFPSSNSWYSFLKEALSEDYFLKLQEKLNLAYNVNPDQIFPPRSQIYRAFELCPIEQLKVVILGQDPYPTLGHAHGLCFSVEAQVHPLPKSLKNILKERKSDLGVADLPNGDLSHWAKQGVLMLNTVLTVGQGKPDSHKNWGWEKFTAKIIGKIAEEKTNIVFILWGAKAQNMALNIDTKKHLLLKAAHPSPLAAYKGFFGCNHFSKTNDFLQLKGHQKIQW